MIVRGLGTIDDRLAALDVARKLGRIDEPMYRTGLARLEEAAAKEPSCRTFAELVEWTRADRSTS